MIGFSSAQSSIRTNYGFIVSTLCQPTRKLSEGPTKLRRYTTVGRRENPFLADKIAVPVSAGSLLDPDSLLDTQEVTGSSPVSPNRRKS